MITRIDHIDIKVEDLDATVAMLGKLGLKILRRAPAPRSSVEMSLEGENQVVLEIHPVKAGGFTGVHHIAFRADPKDTLSLKAQGIKFKTENKFIADTGRTVSSFSDANGLTWQLTD
ncbi:VOC family protein [Oscillibacter sp. MSJ-2]|uniref:VOC family protein n=1 Tax=Dysosmobacter acutus TaxID=2841504 RepID=A0ABS6F4X9_9FIRM|nr:VOC family protein [Dysosmobacter acutus]MBU5625353.1 VOC family protein [Dysosmobacter acutus]